MIKESWSLVLSERRVGDDDPVPVPCARTDTVWQVVYDLFASTKGAKFRIKDVSLLFCFGLAILYC